MGHVQLQKQSAVFKNDERPGHQRISRSLVGRTHHHDRHIADDSENILFRQCAERHDYPAHHGTRHQGRTNENGIDRNSVSDYATDFDLVKISIQALNFI